MTEFPETRSTLLARVRTPEDREAWKQFVLIYRPVIYRMASRRGMQDADAQDLAQSVLMRVAGAIDRWEKSDPETRFRHWLRRVAKNAILTSLSRSPEDVGVGGSNIHELVDHANLAPNVEQELDLEYMREQYLRAAAIVMTDVNSETWRAFELTWIQDSPTKAAAVELDVDPNWIYKAKFLVQQKLKEEIKRLSFDSVVFQK